MTLKYIGERAMGKSEFRIAEFNYNIGEEDERAERIFDALREEGYDVDSGIEGWAAIRIEDKSEFKEIMRIFKKLKRTIR